MPIRYEVHQGDCISSIAFKHGFFPDTLWNDPANAELKKKRGDPNVLLPGDIVTIPDKRTKEVSRATGEVHKFRRKGVPEKLKLQLLIEGEPRANEPYKIEIDALTFAGATDSKGRIECSIPPDARQGRLLLKDGAEVYELQLGHLDPLDQISGLQGRLHHLGFYRGAIDGQMSASTELAILEFQLSQNLETTGEPDAATLNALQQTYGG